MEKEVTCPGRGDCLKYIPEKGYWGKVMECRHGCTLDPCLGYIYCKNKMPLHLYESQDGFCAECTKALKAREEAKSSPQTEITLVALPSRDCPGQGRCIQSYIPGTFTYSPAGECQHRCHLIRCTAYSFCGVAAPEWLLEQNGEGLCPGCGECLEKYYGVVK